MLSNASGMNFIRTTGPACTSIWNASFKYGYDKSTLTGNKFWQIDKIQWFFFEGWRTFLRGGEMVSHICRLLFLHLINSIIFMFRIHLFCMLVNIQYVNTLTLYHGTTKIETIPLMESVVIFDMCRTSIISRIWFCLTPSFSISSFIRRRSKAISWTK